MDDESWWWRKWWTSIWEMWRWLISMKCIRKLIAETKWCTSKWAIIDISTVVTFEIKHWNSFHIILVFYFARNHALNWIKIVSATERVAKLFRNYFSDVEHAGKYSRTAAIIWNNFEIISDKFHTLKIKLFQTGVDEGRNNFEIIVF